jgi:hypothetical protein
MVFVVLACFIPFLPMGAPIVTPGGFDWSI